MTINASDLGTGIHTRVIPKFNQYTPRYIYLALDQKNEVTIKSVLRQLGFKSNQYDFRYHCSILYNKDETSPKKDYTLELTKPITDVVIKDVGVLGDYIVLFLEDNYIIDLIRQDFLDMGYDTTHMDFIPHVSILKDTVNSIDLGILRKNINRLKSSKLRFTDLVYDNNNIKHYG